ncbi:MULTISPECIES: hypothetical protein [Chryseobacterium]|uniref:Uncharacterized protein n=1 Tax=Chryseobacterium camelliae TaxID=1265445 RepID=A0ABU0TH90_9FLAO|nr:MULTISPECIES: hypothetical protein [Chryseobacterium]MDT3405777.1 hypothetical protein [Pseudacidovorax intermedius]MDQ1096415.1 hypothetical protein [Chryseobacterium camelliae]MDQ1100356.1 hypothetical protein [Chryseobacterium sp. SORGH_AS_1048]MDR6087697.1 hypothetical protein [Chryseobacterium sp. SORGH_AS_0909]MDR6132072.1 hypothetical protein [Chryseobacterium sp. SORGH_AS_1175]
MITGYSNINSYFNAICKFRQLNPVVKGQPLRTHDPGMMTIRDALLGLKQVLEHRYNAVEDIDFSIQVSRGITNLPNILYSCILPPGQVVPNGIYTAVCFDILGRGALVGCVESKVTAKGLSTVQRKTNGNPLNIDVDGASERTKYNNVFVNPKEFYYPQEDDTELDAHIKASIQLAVGFLSI